MRSGTRTTTRSGRWGLKETGSGNINSSKTDVTKLSNRGGLE